MHGAGRAAERGLEAAHPHAERLLLPAVDHPELGLLRLLLLSVPAPARSPIPAAAASGRRARDPAAHPHRTRAPRRADDAHALGRAHEVRRVPELARPALAPQHAAREEPERAGLRAAVRVDARARRVALARVREGRGGGGAERGAGRDAGAEGGRGGLEEGGGEEREERAQEREGRAVLGGGGRVCGGGAGRVRGRGEGCGRERVEAEDDLRVRYGGRACGGGGSGGFGFAFCGEVGRVGGEEDDGPVRLGLAARGEEEGAAEGGERDGGLGGVGGRVHEPERAFVDDDEDFLAHGRRGGDARERE